MSLEIMHLAVAFVVYAAGEHLLAEMAGQVGHGRGPESRAKVRGDSPGTWETRTAPPRESGSWVTIGMEPETSRPALIQPSWSSAGDTNKVGGRWYGQAKATKRSGGWQEGVLARA